MQLYKENKLVKGFLTTRRNNPQASAQVSVPPSARTPFSPVRQPFTASQ